MCRQTDTLPVQEGFPRLLSSEGTGCLVAPESKYPRTAPETCVHVKGGLWEEGAPPSGPLTPPALGVPSVWGPGSSLCSLPTVL